MEPHQFAQFGPFIATAGEFAKATRRWLISWRMYEEVGRQVHSKPQVVRT